jgi:hypothetical protein
MKNKVSEALVNIGAQINPADYCSKAQVLVNSTNIEPYFEFRAFTSFLIARRTLSHEMKDGQVMQTRVEYTSPCNPVTCINGF